MPPYPLPSSFSVYGITFNYTTSSSLTIINIISTQEKNIDAFLLRKKRSEKVRYAERKEDEQKIRGTHTWTNQINEEYCYKLWSEN